MKLYKNESVLTDEEYNKKVVKKLSEVVGDYYSDLNHFVMDHTCGKCIFDDELSSSVSNSFARKQIIYEKDQIIHNFDKRPTTNVEVVNKRTFEAASYYKGKKIAVLDFANIKHPGGAPWSAGAQEESLCRCSTLQRCLHLSEPLYYDLHKDVDYWGSSDLIYIPEVVVFKSDDSAPVMLEKDQRFKVDVIVSAAPHLGGDYYFGWIEYDMLMTERLRKVFEIAQKNGVEVLILGAYGCGAFNNPPEIVAQVFKKLLSQYYFPRVEFAISGHRKNNNYEVFKKIIESEG